METARLILNSITRPTLTTLTGAFLIRNFVADTISRKGTALSEKKSASTFLYQSTSKLRPENRSCGLFADSLATDLTKRCTHRMFTQSARAKINAASI